MSDNNNHNSADNHIDVLQLFLLNHHVSTQLSLYIFLLRPTTTSDLKHFLQQQYEVNINTLELLKTTFNVDNQEFIDNCVEYFQKFNEEEFEMLLWYLKETQPNAYSKLCNVDYNVFMKNIFNKVFEIDVALMKSSVIEEENKSLKEQIEILNSEIKTFKLDFTPTRKPRNKENKEHQKEIEKQSNQGTNTELEITNNNSEIPKDNQNAVLKQSKTSGNQEERKSKNSHSKYFTTSVDLDKDVLNFCIGIEKYLGSNDEPCLKKRKIITECKRVVEKIKSSDVKNDSSSTTIHNFSDRVIVLSKNKKDEELIDLLKVEWKNCLKDLNECEKRSKEI